MLKGAEVVLTPNACELQDDAAGIGDIRVAQFRSRAFENAIGVAMANYAAPQLDGRSVAFDVDRATLVQAEAEEGVFVAKFDLDRIRRWRATERSNIWRRPEVYGSLANRETTCSRPSLVTIISTRSRATSRGLCENSEEIR